MLFLDKRDLRSKEKGIALLYAVGAIALLGALATAITILTPSSTITEINENRFGQAYYAAYSGLQYLKYAESGIYKDIATFTKTINSGTPYVLSSSGATADISVSSIDATHYTINYIIGSTTGEMVKSENYMLLNGATRSFIAYSSPVPKALGAYVTATNGLTNAQGTIDGDLLSGTFVFNPGVIITGSVISTSTTETLNIKVGKIGGTGKYVCSDSGVVLNGNEVDGNVYAHGDVSYNNGVVAGDIYATGDVTVSNGSVEFSHNIYAGGNVYIKNAYITGNIYAAGNVVIGGSWPRVTGQIHSQQAVTINDGAVSGNVYDINGLSVAASYMFTGYEYKNPTKPLSVMNCPEKVTWTMTQHPATSDFYIGNGAYGSLSDNVDASNKYYYFNSFTIGGSGSGGWGNFCLDISHDGGIVNFVANNLSERGNYYVNTKSLSNCYGSMMNSMDVSYYASASKFYTEVYGNVTMSGGSDWFGTIFSNGDITLGGGSIVVGALYSVNGTINLSGSGGTKIRYVQADYLK